MRLYLFFALGLVGSVLQVMVIWAMTKGAFRRYPGVFFYLLVLFLTSTADFGAFLDPSGFGGWYRNIYLINNLLRQFSGLIAVLSLIFLATASHPQKGAVRIRVVIATVAVVAGAFLLTGGDSWGTYIVRVFRILSITNALLNIVLWFELIRTRNRDRCVLLVCGGLGLNMAGEAIAQSLLAVSSGDVAWWVANLVGVLSHLFCLLIWWVAFRKAYVPLGVSSRAVSR